MSITDLLSGLHSLGVKLAVAENHLVVDTPESMLPAGAWAEISEREGEILSLLAERCLACWSPVEVVYRADYIGLFCKADPLHHSRLIEGEQGTCVDCSGDAVLINSLCFRCNEVRLFLPAEACAACSGTRYWRHRDGFKWYCTACELPPARSIVCDLTVSLGQAETRKATA